MEKTVGILPAFESRSCSDCTGLRFALCQFEYDRECDFRILIDDDGNPAFCDAGYYHDFHLGTEYSQKSVYI